MMLVFAPVVPSLHSVRFSGVCVGVTIAAKKHGNTWRSFALDAVQRQIAKLKADLPGTIVANVKNAQKRNVKI